MRGRLVSVVFYALFAAFVAWYVRGLAWERLRGLEVEYWSLGVATGLGILTRYCGVVTWIQILNGLGAGRITMGPDLSFIYAKAWLGRYLPGKVTWILGKVYFASNRGISRQTLSVGSVFEAALQTTVTLFLALLVLSIDPRLDVFSRSQTALMIAGSVVLLVAMTPAVFNRLMELACRALRKPPIGADSRVTLALLARGASLYGVTFLLGGLAFYFLAKSLHGDLGAEHVFFLSAVYNLAGAVGVLSIFAPSGLGVRESIQLLLLPLVMPAEIALVITIVARIWSLVVDLLFFAITWLHRALATEDRGESQAQLSNETP